MSFEIIKGSTKFEFAFNDPEQIKKWLLETKPLNGLCFTGRSNVGKSSLINSLFGKATARISKTPGRTRSINIFSFNILQRSEEGHTTHTPFYLFDLPGYGYAKVSNEMAKNWNEILGLFFRYCPATVRVLNIQDARHPFQKSDSFFLDFIKKYHHLNSILIFNKIDKLKTQKERSALQKSTVFKEQDYFREVHFLSAQTKKGVPELEQSMITFFHSKELLN